MTDTSDVREAGRRTFLTVSATMAGGLVVVDRSEMGQGVMTAPRMLVAGELDADMPIRAEDLGA